jgi:hypothetical protein
MTAHSPTGPQPMTTTVKSLKSSGLKCEKPLLAAKYPVGQISAINTKYLSSMPGGALTAVASARGTRTYGA